MNKIIYSLPFLAILCSSVNTITMEKNKMNLLVIPDSKEPYDHNVGVIFSNTQYNIIQMSNSNNLRSKTKQEYENLIETTIKEHSGKIFIYTVKGGVSFAFNYAAKHPNRIAGILTQNALLTEHHYLFDLCRKISPDIPILLIHYGDHPTNSMALYHHLTLNTGRSKKPLNTCCLIYYKNTAIQSNYHLLERINLFLKIKELKYESNNFTESAQTETSQQMHLVPPDSFTTKEEIQDIQNLTQEENKRYYKDWALIIIPSSLFILACLAACKYILLK